MTWRPRATDLILVPVLLLTGIAGFGLVEYRHVIAAEARETAQKWITESSTSIHEGLIARTRASVPVVLYRQIPQESSDVGEQAKLLERAIQDADEEGLRGLVLSDERTATGLPVRVLAAWHVFRLTNGAADIKVLAELALHQAPSAISESIIDSVFPETELEWQQTERKRAVLKENQNAEGFVRSRNEPVAFVTESKVALPEEMHAIEDAQLSDRPGWMTARVAARGAILPKGAQPLSQPLVSAGFPIRIETGVGKPAELYARYWRVVWWVVAVMVCSAGTAVAGCVLVRRTVDRERRLGELKSQFVASVSHELRTPVASMRLMADALLAGKVDREARREFPQLMSQEGARLSALIENVLDFSRIEEGRKDYQLEEADLSRVIADVVRLMEPVAAERGVTMEASRPDVMEILLDAEAMVRALVNLIDNALKFSPQGSTVRVTLDGHANQWKLVVADQGPGIPAEDRERVFERFSRLGNELRREVQGAGIGLSIVRHIVEAHGGRIHVEDNADAGASFIITHTSS